MDRVSLQTYEQVCRWLALTMIAGFIALFVGIGLDSTRVSLGGGFLATGAITAFAAFHTIATGEVPVPRRRRSLWSEEPSVCLSDKSSPLRYWTWLILTSCLAIASFVTAILYVFGWIDRQIEPESAPVRHHLSGWSQLVAIGCAVVLYLASFACWFMTRGHLRPGVKLGIRRVLFPWHVTWSGLPWLLAFYLTAIAGLVVMLFSGQIAMWLDRLATGG